MPHPLYTLDVFTDTRYTGNQLVVVRHSADLDDDAMQAIAREMNYSETTFIASDTTRDGGFDVRIFTPNNELPFAGHPTLGTAFIIQQEILHDTPASIVLNLGVGPIKVDIIYESGRPTELWMTQKDPDWIGEHTAEELAKIIGVSPDGIDSRHPIESIFTGVPVVVVPLRTLDIVCKAKIDGNAYADFLRRHGDLGILVFAPETYDQANDLNVRVFVDCFGIPEDPATGSANGCLAAWLSKHKYLGSSKVEAAVEQGCEIKRPSRLFLKADTSSIQVGGSVVMVSKGELL